MFSVGVLYSGQTLLDIVGEGELRTNNFATSFAKIEVAEASVVLCVAQKCRWIAIEPDGAIRLTERGRHLAQMADVKLRLREQLLDLIVADPPPWAKRLMQGRFEALQAMPDPARQCFGDCDLVHGVDDGTVEWWDRASYGVRTERLRICHEVGRAAEKLTLAFERQRTGEEPIWQAIETTVSGFDVLSVVAAGSDARLKIEVKGSRMRCDDASFFITRNEWQTALKSRHFQFHLWLLHQVPRLFIVPARQLLKLVPTDGAGGQWETAQLVYRDFLEFETSAFASAQVQSLTRGMAHAAVAQASGD